MVKVKMLDLTSILGGCTHSWFLVQVEAYHPLLEMILMSFIRQVQDTPALEMPHITAHIGHICVCEF